MRHYNLDAALARAPHGSYLSVTSTDTAALYGIYPAVARRHYGAETGGGGAGNPARPPWFKELGVRILLGALTKAGGCTS
jgi:tRNA G26 N,N-dimethylase Trm1